ncbi:MAG: lipoprotein [Candidatus Thiodiazotropha lotti]|nr:lipoprotein [Candidatus Thiodiazotropha lotti]
MKPIHYCSFLILSIVALTLSGCGQKGPLHNPPENPMQQSEQQQAS